MKEATRKVIQRLKEVKAQKDLSCMDIVDICDEHGESVSLSSVRRIFAKGSEDGPDFRPYTINAIFRAVIGTEDVELTSAMSDTEREVLAENAALKAVIELRDATIADLQRQIDTLQHENDSARRDLEVATIRLETTNYMFKLAMESLGKSS